MKHRHECECGKVHDMIDLQMELVEKDGRHTAYISDLPTLSSTKKSPEAARESLLKKLVKAFTSLEDYTGWVSIRGKAHMQVMRDGERYLACGLEITHIPLKDEGSPRCPNCLSMYQDGS